ISCLMYRLSALDPSALSSQDCSLHMIAALQQYAKLKATLKALVRSASFPQPRTDALAKLRDLPTDAVARLQTPANLTGVGRLRTTARLLKRHIRDAFRSRLTDAIDKAGLTGVVRFAPQLGDGSVMEALWLMEEGGGWGEVEKGLRLAAEYSYCQLPILIDAGDLQKHDTKMAYLSMPRVAAQWLIVGRHVVFCRADGQQNGTFEVFRDPSTNEIRAIRDEPEFALTLNPPLPTDGVHPFQQHPFQQHMKHVVTIEYAEYAEGDGEWVAGWAEFICASVSTFIMDMITRHFTRSGFQLHFTEVDIDRGARGGYLDGLLTRSPHTSLEGCAAVMTEEGADGTACQVHVLTASDDPCIAWITFCVTAYDRQTVSVSLLTTEQPVGNPSDPFSVRCRRSAWLARRSLGPFARIFSDGQTYAT
ncbi:unnamed protein product, partial [Vitrella brassicaformis CCMP3155]